MIRKVRYIAKQDTEPMVRSVAWKAADRRVIRIGVSWGDFGLWCAKMSPPKSLVQHSFLAATMPVSHLAFAVAFHSDYPAPV